MKHILLLGFFFLLGNNIAEAQTYADIPGPENVLVVYNSLSDTSKLVKDYYVNARGIPETNILGLDSLIDLDIYDPETQTTHQVALRSARGNNYGCNQ